MSLATGISSPALPILTPDPNPPIFVAVRILREPKRDEGGRYLVVEKPSRKLTLGSLVCLERRFPKPEHRTSSWVSIATGVEAAITAFNTLRFDIVEVVLHTMGANRPNDYLTIFLDDNIFTFPPETLTSFTCLRPFLLWSTTEDIPREDVFESADESRRESYALALLGIGEKNRRLGSAFGEGSSLQPTASKLRVALEHYKYSECSEADDEDEGSNNMEDIDDDKAESEESVEV